MLSLLQLFGFGARPKKPVPSPLPQHSRDAVSLPRVLEEARRSCLNDDGTISVKKLRSIFPVLSPFYIVFNEKGKAQAQREGVVYNRPNLSSVFASPDSGMPVVCGYLCVVIERTPDYMLVDREFNLRLR
ncbi:MAG: hypothetical protein WDN10_03990 [bacterium]